MQTHAIAAEIDRMDYLIANYITMYGRKSKGLLVLERKRDRLQVRLDKRRAGQCDAPFCALAFEHTGAHRVS